MNAMRTAPTKLRSRIFVCGPRSLRLLHQEPIFEIDNSPLDRGRRRVLDLAYPAGENTIPKYQSGGAGWYHFAVRNSRSISNRRMWRAMTKSK